MKFNHIFKRSYNFQISCVNICIFYLEHRHLFRQIVRFLRRNFNHSWHWLSLSSKLHFSNSSGAAYVDSIYKLGPDPEETFLSTLRASDCYENNRQCCYCDNQIAASDVRLSSVRLNETKRQRHRARVRNDANKKGLLQNKSLGSSCFNIFSDHCISTTLVSRQQRMNVYLYHARKQFHTVQARICCVHSSPTVFQICNKILEICSLLGYYAAPSGNHLPTLRNNLSVPLSRIKKSFLDFLILERRKGWAVPERR
jgi:hypothetical protein